MELSIAEIAVIMDTLAGSLRIADGGRIFGYTAETREGVLSRITQQAAQQSVHLTASGAGGRGDNPLQSNLFADDPSATHGGR